MWLHLRRIPLVLPEVWGCRMRVLELGCGYPGCLCNDSDCPCHCEHPDWDSEPRLPEEDLRGAAPKVADLIDAINQAVAEGKP